MKRSSLSKRCTALGLALILVAMLIPAGALAEEAAEDVAPENSQEQSIEGTVDQGGEQGVDQGINDAAETPDALPEEEEQEANGEAIDALKTEEPELAAILNEETGEGDTVETFAAPAGMTFGAAFPDEMFCSIVMRTVLSLPVGADPTATISQEQADAIAAYTALSMNGSGIASLAGIEYFTSLTSLKCGTNSFTTLDLSSNTALQDLDCSRTGITSLNLSNNPSLITLDCGNNNISTLDVSNNLALESLWFNDCSVTSIDLSNNSALRSINCNDNQLTSLDVSNCTRLNNLDCSENQITSLDVSNCTNLDTLDCSKNQLTGLVLGNTAVMRTMNCSYNQIASIDVSGSTGLTSLDCGYNELVSLDLSNNTNLASVYCDYNHLVTVVGASALTASTFLAEGQTAIVPVVISSGSTTYESRTYPLETGFNMAITQAIASYDAANQLFLTGDLTTVDFESTDGTRTVSGTITFALAGFTVTFVDWDSTVLATQVVPSGADAIEPPAPTRQGYTFTGWDVPFTQVTQDLVVTAVYTQDPPTPTTPEAPDTTPPDNQKLTNTWDDLGRLMLPIGLAVLFLCLGLLLLAAGKWERKSS